MKRSILILTLALLSLASGYLMSESSWIGKAGITFFYKICNFTKIWWQGALVVFLAQLGFIAIHTFIRDRFSVVMARILHFCLLIVAKLGLYFSYDDLNHTLTHRMLGWRFHYGFYLIWFGFIITSCFFIAKKSGITDQGSTETAIE